MVVNTPVCVKMKVARVLAPWYASPVCRVALLVDDTYSATYGTKATGMILRIHDGMVLFATPPVSKYLSF